MASQTQDITQDLPYTVVGHTSTPNPKLSILLTAEGLKALAEKTEPGDMVRLTIWDDVTEECEKKRHFQKFEIVKRSQP